VSLGRRSTGDRSPALRRTDALSSFALSLFLVLALYASFAPAAGATAHRRTASPQMAAATPLTGEGRPAAHAAVETIRRMPVAVLRNTDTPSALAQTVGIAAEIATFTPAALPEGVLSCERGVKPSTRAPPQVADIWA
jgi:hypothetical protein